MAKGTIYAEHWLSQPLDPASAEDIEVRLSTFVENDDQGPRANGVRRLRENAGFAAQYFHRWATAGSAQDGSDLLMALRCEKTLTDLQHFLLRCYAKEFRRRYDGLIKRFRAYCAGADVLIVHVTWERNLDLARRSALSFSLPTMRNLFVIGTGQSSPYAFDAGRGVLSVPASDYYEGLPHKAGAALHFLGFAGPMLPIVKVDDDITCRKPAALLDALRVVGQIGDYAGTVFDPTRAIGGLDRTWHMGKCRDPAINTRPYSFIPHTAYAQGPIYYVSAPATQVVSKAYLMFSDFFSTVLYEDLAIGTVLGHFSIRPVDFCFKAAGLVADAAAPATDRLPDLDEAETKRRA